MALFAIFSKADIPNFAFPAKEATFIAKQASPCALVETTHWC